MESDNLEPVVSAYQARELTQLEAVTMAMDDADHRGLAGNPQAFLDGLPFGWALVNTNAIASLAGALLDRLEPGGLDGDDSAECADCGHRYRTHSAGCPRLPQLVHVREA